MIYACIAKYDLIVLNTKSIILKQEKLKISPANPKVPLATPFQTLNRQLNIVETTILLEKHNRDVVQILNR